MSHSETPFQKDRKNGRVIISDYIKVATCNRKGPEAWEDAEFIVKACNSHDALVEAIMSVKRKLHFGTGGDWSNVIAIVEAAQAKVEGRA